MHFWGGMEDSRSTVGLKKGVEKKERMREERQRTTVFKLKEKGRRYEEENGKKGEGRRSGSN